MRFLRLTAVAVLLLVLLGGVLGMACTGAEGEQGPKGDTGADGVGIESIVNNGDGTFTLEMTDGSSYTTDDLTGPAGSTGVGVESVVDNEDGTFALNMTDGSSFTTPNMTGPQGTQGPQGIQGEQGPVGPQGEPGANMIVAMGAISYSGAIDYGYNIDSCIWDGDSNCYEITLTGITYSYDEFVTIVTPVYTNHCFGGYGGGTGSDGKLIVIIQNTAGTQIQNWFSFMVLAVPTT